MHWPVRDRTSAQEAYSLGSHEMQYGDLDLNAHSLYLFMGNHVNATTWSKSRPLSRSAAVNQRDADLLYLWSKYRKSGEGSLAKSEARRQLVEMMAPRSRVDGSVELVAVLLFGSDQASKVLNAVRPAGQPLGDDWECLKSMVRRFEERCRPLGQYVMKHMRSLANMCNAGVGEEAMAKGVSQACAN